MVFSFSVRETKDKEFLKEVHTSCKRQGKSFSALIIRALRYYMENNND
jgi:hypothetical protein